MPPLDLNDLALFAAIAKQRNFRRAAKERGVSASTLSQAVRDLEQHLGVRLLNRTTRSVTPTIAGQALLERLAPLLDELGAAVSDVTSMAESATGRLRLNVPGSVSELVLAPMIGPFLAAYPGITLELVEDNGFIDVFEAGFDAGARYDEALEQDMISVPLGPPQSYRLAASPDHIARYGQPNHPQDLLHRPGLFHRFPSGALLPWEFEKDGVALTVKPEARLITNNTQLAIQAAEAGIGWIFTIDGFLRPALQNERLVSILDDWCPPFPGPRLYYPSRRFIPAALKAFVSFSRQYFSQKDDASV